MSRGSRWKLVAVPLSTLAIAAPLLVSCRHDTARAPAAKGSATPGAPEMCGGIITGKFDDLEFIGPQGTGENVKRLLPQAVKLSRTAQQFEKDLIDACFELGFAAGVPENELKANPDKGHGAERTCSVAAAKVKKMFDAAKDAKVVLDLSIESTHCYVDVGAAKKCLAECGAPVTKGDDRASCVGGEIDGTCTGRCGGACSLDAGPGLGICHATCSGKCDREFRGVCGGKCSGTCNGKPTRGPQKCAGVCDGSCSEKAEGLCGGTCAGSCSGVWEPRDTYKCAGLCAGACQPPGELKDLLCTGEYMPPGIESVCQATCAAAGALALKCDLPMVRVTAKGQGKQSPELQKMLAGVQSAVPKILKLVDGAGKRWPRAMEIASAAGVEWSNAYATVGAKPLFCIRQSLDVMKEASAWIDTTVKAADPIRPAIKTDPPVTQKADDD
jgi:hypothetical protein